MELDQYASTVSKRYYVLPPKFRVVTCKATVFEIYKLVSGLSVMYVNFITE